jgi:hypothetical protein
MPIIPGKRIMPRTRNRLRRAHAARLLRLTTLGVTLAITGAAAMAAPGLAAALAYAVGSMATVGGLTVSQERP